MIARINDCRIRFSLNIEIEFRVIFGSDSDFVPPKVTDLRFAMFYAFVYCETEKILSSERISL